jgi:hypothetical protein
MRLKLDEEEKQFIIEALNKRKCFYNSDVAFYEKAIKILNSILQKTNNLEIDVSPVEKAFINGCLKEYFINPDNELYSLSDIEIIKNYKKLYPLCITYDKICHLSNRLKLDKKDEHHTHIKRFEIASALMKSKKVYYSMTPQNKLHKIGFETSKGDGMSMKISNDNSIQKLELGKLTTRGLTISETPSNLLKLLIDFKETDSVNNDNVALAIEILKSASM